VNKYLIYIQKNIYTASNLLTTLKTGKSTMYPKNQNGCFITKLSTIIALS